LPITDQVHMSEPLNGEVQDNKTLEEHSDRCLSAAKVVVAHPGE